MAIHTFTGKVTERAMLTDDVLFLKLEIPLFSFRAGQFVTIKITRDGVTRLKSYSIFSSPSEKNTLHLCIKIVEGGFASEIFKKTVIGDEFELKGPFGHFVFDETDSSKEQWFLGAGTGVAPLYSMIKEYLPRCPEKRFVLLFGVRTYQGLFYHTIFRQLEQTYSHFTYLPVLSREDWSGKKGHVQDHLPEDLRNKTFYICGLKELVLQTKELLVQRGVPPQLIKSERYD